MAPWDENLPAGNAPWNVGDDAIRANNAALATAVAREHEPLTDASTGGVHKQGSARAHVWTGATLDSSALNSNFNNPSSAKNTGKIVLDQPEGRIWICRDGAGGNWVELSEISGALNLLSTLTVAGLLTANNGVTIPTTKKLTLPAAENHVVIGAESFDLSNHAARHIVGGGDSIAWLIQSLQTAYAADVANGTGFKVSTSGFDFTSRGGVSRVLVFGYLIGRTSDVTVGQARIFTARLVHSDDAVNNAIANTSYEVSAMQSGAAANKDSATWISFALVTNVPADSAQVFRIEVTADAVTQGVLHTFDTAAIIAIDLGEV